MRIGDATFYLRFLAGLRENRARSEQALRELADGKKVRSASDDPAGTQESLALRTRLARLAGYDRSAASARASLATVDSVLGEVLDLLTEAQTEAMAGASTPTENANEIRAQQIERLRNELLRLANTSQNGRYVFAGTETAVAPFDSGGTYAGNDDEVQAPIDTREQLGATLSGDRVFIAGVDLFDLMTDLADALRDGRTDDIGALVPVFNDALDHVGQIRGDVGFRMRRIDQMLIRHDDETLGLLGRIGQIEDADLAEVAVQLQASETATSALSAAAVRVLGRSLFDQMG